MRWEFKRKGNAAAVVEEIIRTVHLNGLHDNSNLLQGNVTIKSGTPNIDELSDLTVIDVIACLPKKCKGEQLRDFSLDNIFLGNVSEDLFAPSKTHISVTWFMCKTPPEKLLVKLSGSILREYKDELIEQIKLIIKRGDIYSYGVFID